MNKIESGAIELQEGKFNLADLIDNMVTMVLPQINEHSHELQVSVSSLKHEWVVGDSLRIQQAFCKSDLQRRQIYAGRRENPCDSAGKAVSQSKLRRI